MNNKIVWVYGASAAGKETFIRYLEDNQPEEILKRLHFNNKKIIVCKESLDWVAQSSNDPKKDLRKGLAAVINNYSRENSGSVILVKGQDDDFDNKHLTTVEAALPEDSHEILYLYTNFQDLYDRYIQKPWWDESMSKEVCRDWLEEQVKMIKTHASRGFRVSAVDSGTQKYEDANFPPRLFE